MLSAFRRKGNAKFANTPPPSTTSVTTMDGPGEVYRKTGDGSLPGPGEMNRAIATSPGRRYSTPQPKAAPRTKPTKPSRAISDLGPRVENASNGSDPKALVTEAIELLQRSLSLVDEDKVARLTEELAKAKSENKQLNDRIASIQQEQQNGGQENRKLSAELDELKTHYDQLKHQYAMLQGVASKLNDQNKEMQLRIKEFEAKNNADEKNKAVSRLISNYWQLENTERTTALRALQSDFETSELGSGSLATDNKRQEFLSDLFAVSFQLAKDHVDTLNGRLAHSLRYPGSLSQEVQESLDLREDPSILPDALREEISKFLKANTNVWPLKELEHGIVDWIEEEFGSDITNNDIMESYISNCCRLSWELNIEYPPFIIENDTRRYDHRRHQPDGTCKLETIPEDGSEIDHFVWPALLDKAGGKVLKKGMVMMK
ncbi:uncharacterized protein [Ptychodera flava]|uniref:uncharacterized protein n=1 Tax=Ptychodera flava TaxID=63121 RepID=UPI00396A0777